MIQDNVISRVELRDYRYGIGVRFAHRASTAQRVCVQGCCWMAVFAADPGGGGSDPYFSVSVIVHDVYAC